MRDLFQIVSMAIIADIMPLRDINRVMVQKGLEIFAKSNRPFARAYMQYCNIDRLRADDIAFGIAPILNSAGRMADASIACDYLCSENIYEARNLLQRLLELNRERKKTESRITLEAIEMISAEKKVQVLYSEDWHEGVLGIVASRVAEYCKTPAIILTKKTDIYKGSGRSYGSCRLFDLINLHRELLNRFGGHDAAVGLSIAVDKIDDFVIELNNSAKIFCTQDKKNDNGIMGELPFSLIDFELYAVIERYEPYGEGNPKPLFFTRDVEIVSVMQIGREKNHLRLQLREGEKILNGVKFRIDKKEKDKYIVGERIDIVYRIGENIFRGEKTLQLVIESII